MSSVLAAVRPDSWNLPLLVHVVGAMILVGAADRRERARVRARRRPLPAPRVLDAPSRRSARLRSSCAIGAQWIYAKDGFDDARGDEPAWLDIGWSSADAGALLLLDRTDPRRDRRPPPRRRQGTGLLKATMVIAWVVLAAAVVAVWAMAGKPD